MQDIWAALNARRELARWFAVAVSLVGKVLIVCGRVHASPLHTLLVLVRSMSVLYITDSHGRVVAKRVAGHRSSVWWRHALPIRR